MFHKYVMLIHNLMGATLSSIIGLFDGSPMRGLAVGLRAGTSRVDIALGPVIGGILMQRFAWDSVFWVCAVIGIMGSLQAGAYTTGLTDALRGSYLPPGHPWRIQGIRDGCRIHFRLPAGHPAQIAG